MAKPVLVKNTEDMMMNLDFPSYIKVAELGCSSGQNSFVAISEIINTINGHVSESKLDEFNMPYAHHVAKHASCRNKTSVTLVVSLAKNSCIPRHVMMPFLVLESKA
uniref:Uncharacterized protein n=1 Tax=Brassica campestris TaxID=3711 RepID=A0A3P5ZNR4_BRACM|nr:unnamed protein product [Brassica rapa]